MFFSIYLNTIPSFFTVFAETINVPPCVASPGPSGNAHSINHALILMIAVQFNISLAEAESAIRASLSDAPITFITRPEGWWKTQLDPGDLFPFYCDFKKNRFKTLEDFFYARIIINNIPPEIIAWLEELYQLFEMFPPSLVPNLIANKNTLLLSSLVFLSAFIFLQVFFVQDVLLLFVVMDLALSVFAVLFSLTGLFASDFFALAFFFILLTLAACETAISLGFLVSFSRRHKSAGLTLSSLRYAII